MRGARLAFSFAELLIVCAIILILAGLSLPVIALAKWGAREEEGKAYLHQAYLVLAVYAQDGEDALPPYQTLRALSASSIPRSPLDDWRTPPGQRFEPLIGSFAYSPAVLVNFPGAVTNLTQRGPILADIFSSHYRVSEFSGLFNPDYPGCASAGTCEFPERIWFIYSDGSLYRQRNPTPAPLFAGNLGAVRELFSWPAVFEREAKRHQ